jgi:hypothetical protein
LFFVFWILTAKRRVAGGRVFWWWEMDDLRGNLQIVPRGTIVFSELGVF